MRFLLCLFFVFAICGSFLPWPTQSHRIRHKRDTSQMMTSSTTGEEFGKVRVRRRLSGSTLEENPCDGKVGQNVPKAGDCHAYYFCDIFGNKIEVSCGPTFVYDINTKMCLHPSFSGNYNCDEEEDETEVDDGDDEDDDVDGGEDPCDGKVGQNVPKEGDCHAYYFCDIFGNKIEVSCGPTFVYDLNTKMCLHPSFSANYNCDEEEDETEVDDGDDKDDDEDGREEPIDVFCTANEEPQAVYLNLTTCQYYTCHEGNIMEEFICPERMRFDPNRGFCDWSVKLPPCNPDWSRIDSIIQSSRTCEPPPPITSTTHSIVDTTPYYTQVTTPTNVDDLSTPKTPEGTTPGSPTAVGTTPKSFGRTTPKGSGGTTPTTRPTAVETTPKGSGGTTPKGSGGTTPKGSGGTTPKSSGGTTPTTSPTAVETTPNTSGGTTPKGSGGTTPKGSGGTTPKGSEGTTPKGSGWTTPTTSPTIVETTPGTATGNGTLIEVAKSFVGFVIDDTASMQHEIEAIQLWLSSCANGSISSCSSAPTGGWILSTFNDPDVGPVVGPSHNLTEIIESIGSLTPHGGGDCPEKSFTGIQNAISAVDEVNSGCKIFFFTDATANDEGHFDDVIDQFIRKNCQFVPILTGCCGTCSDPLLLLDPPYSPDIVVATTNMADSRLDLPFYVREDFYYVLANSTKSHIHIAPKPKVSQEFLEMLTNGLTI